MSGQKIEEAWYCRCSLGRNRWYWTAGHLEGWPPVIDVEGVAGSALEAEEQAREAIDALFGPIPAYQWSAKRAAEIHHLAAVRRRTQGGTSSTTDAAAAEYLYADYMSDDGRDFEVKFRIVKKTAKRVYVEYRRERWVENGQTFHDIETVVLDREALERDGHASSSKCCEPFFTTPMESRRDYYTPPFLSLLGLDRGATVDEISVAYRRLAKEHHPDHGGDPEKFKEIHVAFEQAMQTTQP